MNNLPQSVMKDDSKPNENHLQTHENITTKNIIYKKVNSTETLDWIELTQRLYVLQAYLDLRKDSQTFIRFLIIMNKAIENSISLTCSFSTENAVKYTAVRYEFNENHAMEYGGYIYSCEISPKHIHHHDTVILQESNFKKSIILKLKILKSITKKKFNFSICIPPLHGNIDWKKLVAYIEINKLLGANQFFFYTYKFLSVEINKVLQHYSETGLVTLKTWTVPSNNIWYNGQMSNIHHCLYENIGISNYTIFQDIDEILVPLKVDNWQSLMENIDIGQHCGFKVSSVFMKTFDDPLVFLKSNERYKKINNMRSKCIVKPDLIFEQGIHHISKQNVEEFTPQNADPSHVLLYHYRKCDGMFGFSCTETVKEERLKSLLGRFLYIYNKQLKFFG